MANNLTIEEFRAKIDSTRVTCLECNFVGHELVAHLLSAHNMSAGQYKKKHAEGRLCSPMVSELLRRLDRKDKTTDDLSLFIPPFVAGATTNETFQAALQRLPLAAPEQLDLVPAVVKDFFFAPDDSKAVVTGMVNRMNVYMEGPTGCGKTELAYQIHNRLKRPLLRANMNGDATVANFIGSMRASPTKGTYYHYGMLPQAMRGGYCLLLDEVDYMPPHIAAVMNSVLESKRTLYLEETNETIVAKDGFMVIASGNTGGKGDSNGMYTGTEILNSAFLDRFPIKLKMGYLPMDEEVSMLIKRFPAFASEVKVLVKGANEIRQAFLQSQISVTLSTRKLIDYFDLLPTMGELESLKLTLLNWLDDNDRQLVMDLLKRCGVKVS